MTHHWVTHPVPVSTRVNATIESPYVSGLSLTTSLYMDGTLWDSEGYGKSNTCCSFNSRPWFCQHLKHHTSNDLELRLCSYGINKSEDNLISLVEIYVK